MQDNKVMILDDEPAICSLICDLVEWERLGLELCGIVYDGLDAIREIRTKRPDIVITDIQMPGIDGLHLIGTLQEMGITPSFIIISGHDKPDYLHRALKYKVEDYLLKPIKKQELNDLLENVSHKLQEKKKLSLFQSEQMQKSVLHSWKQAIVHRLRDPKYSWTQALEDVYEKDWLSDISFGFLAGIGRFPQGTERPIMGSCILELMDLLEEAQISGRVCSWENLFILFAKGNRKELVIDPQKLLLSLKGRKEKQYQFLLSPVFFSITELGNALPHLWLASKSLKEDTVFWSAGRLACTAATPYEWISPSVKAELFQYLDQQADHKVASWIRRAIYSEAKAENPLARYQVALDLIRTGERELRRRYGQHLELDGESPFVSWEDLFLQLDRQQTGTELIAFVEETLESMVAKVSSKQQSKEKKVVQEAKAYIQTRYADGISLEDVAASVFLTPAYFSVLFKKETGKTYNDYLIEVRLEAAKELLCHTHLRLGEIAERVGYKDSRYFSKLFAERVGIRAQEYRRLYS